MNAITTIDFNGQSLITIEKDGIHYAAVKPIAENIGLTWDSQFRRIKRDDVLSSTVRVIRIVAEDGKNREMMCLPIEYLNGWLFGIDAKRVNPEVKAPLIQYKLQCYKVLHDYWHTGQATHPSIDEDLPSTVKDRNGLVKAARMAQSRLGIGYDEVFNLIHHRFNISRIGELTVNQVGEATEYIQRLVLDQIAEPYRKSDHAQISDDTSPAIYGNVKPMIENTGEATKFVGTIGADGRMSMRELQADEFITTMDGIPEVLHMTYPPDPRKLAKIGMKVSQMLINETIHMQQPVAQIVGGGHEC